MIMQVNDEWVRWFLGGALTQAGIVIGIYIKLITRITRIETLLIIQSKNAAKALHSPDNHLKLDYLLDKYIHDQEFTANDWLELREKCELIIEDPGRTPGERSLAGHLASFVEACCDHRLDLLQNKKKMKLTMMILTAMLGMAIAGCAALSAPPTKFEQAHFDISTNVDYQVKTFTNYYTMTNQQVLTVTNQLNQLVTTTQLVTQLQPVYYTMTNAVEQYTYHPNTNAESLTNTASKLGELSGVPGVGSMISIIGGLVWGAWGTLRSTRRGKGLAVAAQALQTAQEVLAKTPQGARANEELQSWLDRHAEARGATDILAQYVEDHVDNDDAKDAAHRIMTLASVPRPAS